MTTARLTESEVGMVDPASPMGMPVDLAVSTAVRNPYLKDEIDRTEVVLYGIA
jgi:hypothetical protein